MVGEFLSVTLRGHHASYIFQQSEGMSVVHKILQYVTRQETRDVGAHLEAYQKAVSLTFVFLLSN